MSENLLDEVGKEIISDVRDKTIIEWTRILNGSLRTPDLHQYEDVLDSLTDEQRNVFTSLSKDIVDSAIHNFLFYLQTSTTVKLSISTDVETVDDIRTLTTGDLQGYLFIWAESFSKYD